MHDAAATLHAYQAGAGGVFVNAYLVETVGGVVAIDATLTVSDSRAVRARIDQLGKPLLAVLLTHPHPDHYAGVTEVLGGADVPIIATASVDTIIRRDDAAKDQAIGALFGPEWPPVRTFPNTIVADGESVEFDGVAFTVRDTGQGESWADTYWTASALPRVVFAGDLVYGYMDAYNGDGFTGPWLEKLGQLEDQFGDAAVLLPGHGGVTTPAIVAWQRRYLERLREAVRATAQGQPQLTDAQKAEVKRLMNEFLPDDRLELFLDVSLDVVAAELAAAGTPAA
jgi:glyoxylase-like metal-dependent hydrolase (beta-lactamase superfamily II)